MWLSPHSSLTPETPCASRPSGTGRFLAKTASRRTHGKSLGRSRYAGCVRLCGGLNGLASPSIRLKVATNRARATCQKPLAARASRICAVLRELAHALHRSERGSRGRSVQKQNPTPQTGVLTRLHAIDKQLNTGIEHEEPYIRAYHRTPQARSAELEAARCRIEASRRADPPCRLRFTAHMARLPRRACNRRHNCRERCCLPAALPVCSCPYKRR